jgi:hypothetical protein
MLIDMKQYTIDQKNKRQENSIINNSAHYHEHDSNVNSIQVTSSAYKNFFSDKNQLFLQNEIKKGVFDQSNSRYIIAPQSSIHLQRIMLCIFSKDQSTSLDDMNKKVLSFCVPFIHKEAILYEKYRVENEKSSITLLDRFLPVDRNHKQLEYKPR